MLEDPVDEKATKPISRRLVLILIITFLPVIRALPDDLQAPQQVIQSVSDALKQKFSDNNFTQNFRNATEFVNQVITPHTDFDLIAPLVLGKYWKTATPAQQDRFKIEFQTLIIRTYARAFVEYKDWTIQYLPVNLTTTTTKILVKTKVLQPGLQPVEVAYRMLNSSGDWKVYDIVIDGVSLVTNYRATFNDDIQQTGSLDSVIDKLAKKNADALAAKSS